MYQRISAREGTCTKLAYHVFPSFYWWVKLGDPVVCGLRSERRRISGGSADAYLLVQKIALR